MTEIDLITECANKIHKRFTYMKPSEANNTAYEIVSSFRKDNGEMDIEKIRNVVEGICGDANM